MDPKAHDHKILGDKSFKEIIIIYGQVCAEPLTSKTNIGFVKRTLHQSRMKFVTIRILNPINSYNPTKLKTDYVIFFLEMSIVFNAEEFDLLFRVPDNELCKSSLRLLLGLMW